jgi:hypothetical protein
MGFGATVFGGIVVTGDLNKPAKFQPDRTVNVGVIRVKVGDAHFLDLADFANYGEYRKFASFWGTPAQIFGRPGGLPIVAFGSGGNAASAA